MSRPRENREEIWLAFQHEPAKKVAERETSKRKDETI
jgi:hypothetical protein